MKPTELPALITARAEPDRPAHLCAWFLKCDHAATTTRPHPILGAVPICQRCDDLMSRP